jgi:hypothetical protein
MSQSLHDAVGAVHPDRHRIAWSRRMISVTSGPYCFAWRFDDEAEARASVAAFLQRQQGRTAPSRLRANGGAS